MLSGRGIRPRAPGHTVIIMRIGDAEAITGVSVYEPVPSLAALRPEQKFAIAPVHVARGDTITWPLPRGLLWLVYRRASDAQPLPRFDVTGPVMCMPDLGADVSHVSCLVRGAGASMRITHPGTFAGAIEGRLALERRPDP
jgi:hypothetical protein